jgi:HEAT repeat protein
MPGIGGLAGNGGRSATGGSALGAGAGMAGSTLDTSGLSDPDSWQLWWHDHEERFLVLRSHLQTSAARSRTQTLSGQGRAEAASTRRASAEQVKEVIVPLLMELLANQEEPEILDSALIALGRCAPEEDAERVLAAVRPQLSSEVLSVQTSAVLALGIHGSPRFVPLLGAIMADSPAGRVAVGGPVPPLVRSLASVALGLGNHPAAVPLLTDMLATLPDSQLELKSCAITALGSIANAASPEATTELVALLRERRLDAPLKAQVPLALARLDGGTCEEAVPALLAAFADRDVDDRVRASLAQSLGRLASVRQTAAVDALVLAVRKERHVATRHAALMALAEMGLRDASEESQLPDVHKRIAETLAQAVNDPLSYTDKPWAALAAGVYAHGGTQSAAALRLALVEEYHAQNDPAARGACALSLGLAGVGDASKLVLETFREPGEPLLRGYAAVALGLLGVKDATAEMLAICTDKSTEPIVREQVALGLALLQDPAVVPALVEVLGRVQVHPVSLAVARSLGRIGDASAIPDLARLARDASRTDTTRGMAVVALGLLGERGDQPWNASLREMRNAETPVAALQVVFDIL